MITFHECASCRAKPGTPTLCTACLHNRATIDRLLAWLRMALDGWESSDASGVGPGDRAKIDVLRAEIDA
jgi:hypothetical protein